MSQSEFERLLKGDVKSRVEFEPFGSNTKITLSVEIVRKYIAVPAMRDGQTLMPDDRQCMKFLMLCRSRALNPFEGDAFMIPFWNKQISAYEWSLITSHQAFLKRGEVHPEYDGKRSGIIITPQRCKPCDGNGRTDPQGLCPACNGRGWYDELEGDFLPKTIDGEGVTLLGGWCRIYFKGRKNPEYQRLSLETYRKPYGNWAFDAAGMICKCAEAAAMRGAFPTTLGGLYLREEMFQEPDPGTFKKPEFGRGTGAAPAPAVENGKPAIFTPPPKQEDPPNDEAAEAASGVAPEPPPAKPEPEGVGRIALKGVRGLCKAGGIKEGMLLDLLATIGLTDGSMASLDEVAMIRPEVLQDVFERWSQPDGYLSKLKSVK